MQTHLDQNLKLVVLDTHVFDWIEQGNTVGCPALNFKDALPDCLSRANRAQVFGQVYAQVAYPIES